MIHMFSKKNTTLTFWDFCILSENWDVKEGLGVIDGKGQISDLENY